MNLPIYLDNNATTPMDPRVLEAMLPYFTTKFGNAASRNRFFGYPAKGMVTACRVAKFCGKIRQHSFQHPWVHRCGGVIIEVNRDVHCYKL